MARKKIELSEEERRKYNNEMHRKQEQARKERRIRAVYKEIVKSVVETFEDLGWNDADLIVGADEDMVDKVVEELIKKDKFKIVLGVKSGIKLKEVLK